MSIGKIKLKDGSKHNVGLGYFDGVEIDFEMDSAQTYEGDICEFRMPNPQEPTQELVATGYKVSDYVPTRDELRNAKLSVEVHSQDTGGRSLDLYDKECYINRIAGLNLFVTQFLSEEGVSENIMDMKGTAGVVDLSGSGGAFQLLVFDDTITYPYNYTSPNGILTLTVPSKGMYGISLMASLSGIPFKAKVKFATGEAIQNPKIIDDYGYVPINVSSSNFKQEGALYSLKGLDYITYNYDELFRKALKYGSNIKLITSNYPIDIQFLTKSDGRLWYSTITPDGTTPVFYVLNLVLYEASIAVSNETLENINLDKYQLGVFASLYFVQTEQELSNNFTLQYTADGWKFLIESSPVGDPLDMELMGISYEGTPSVGDELQITSNMSNAGITLGQIKLAVVEETD